MKGARIDRIARRLLRDETYRLMVAPAVADLNFEPSRGRRERVRACASASRALLYALADDLMSDALHGLQAITMPSALRHAAGTVVIATSALMVPFVLDFKSLAGPRWLLTLLFLPSAAAIAVLPAVTLATRAAARNSSSTRGFLLAAAAAAVVVFAVIDQGVTRTNRMFREVEGRARGIENIRHGPRELSTVALLRLGPDVAAATGIGYPNQFVREPHLRVAVAVTCIAYALFGLAFARMRLRTAVPAVLVVCVGHFTLMAPGLFVSSRAPGLLAAWIPTMAITFAAITALRIQAYVRRTG